MDACTKFGYTSGRLQAKADACAREGKIGVGDAQADACARLGWGTHKRTLAQELNNDLKPHQSPENSPGRIGRVDPGCSSTVQSHQNAGGKPDA